MWFLFFVCVVGFTVAAIFLVVQMLGLRLPPTTPLMAKFLSTPPPTSAPT